RSYMGLSNINGYTHQTVCHRYNFIDLETSVHTQLVESFNIKIKLEIKKRKGLMNTKSRDFINYFTFLDHFKNDSFEKILALLKIKISSIFYYKNFNLSFNYCKIYFLYIYKSILLFLLTGGQRHLI
ncbi:hypothetical protein DMUE_5561, partial [Dictyocoela muelleri]